LGPFIVLIIHGNGPWEGFIYIQVNANMGVGCVPSFFGCFLSFDVDAYGVAYPYKDLFQPEFLWQ
jgi:hypothetical protein